MNGILTLGWGFAGALALTVLAAPASAGNSQTDVAVSDPLALADRENSFSLDRHPSADTSGMNQAAGPLIAGDKTSSQPGLAVGLAIVCLLAAIGCWAMPRFRQTVARRRWCAAIEARKRERTVLLLQGLTHSTRRAA